MAKNVVLKSEPAESVESVDLGNATAKTLGNNSAGVHETLGPKRYRTF
ncbi:hypothetical protein [Ensifer sp. YR511]|nr:hypothetical protein [Ensifer sp. YR511]SDO22538.1 hypothetical protein SAMN05216328_1705 [Ensifer sp. YR511]